MTKWLPILGVLVFAGCHKHEHSAPAKDATKAVDPVCGMDVVKADAKAKASHAGKDFFFCAAACKDKFEKSLGRYAMGFCDCSEEMPDCKCGHCKALAAKADPTEPCPCEEEEKEKKGEHKHDH